MWLLLGKIIESVTAAGVTAGAEVVTAVGGNFSSRCERDFRIQELDLKKQAHLKEFEFKTMEMKLKMMEHADNIEFKRKEQQFRAEEVNLKHQELMLTFFKPFFVVAVVALVLWLHPSNCDAVVALASAVFPEVGQALRVHAFSPGASPSGDRFLGGGRTLHPSASPTSIGSIFASVYHLTKLTAEFTFNLGLTAVGLFCLFLLVRHLYRVARFRSTISCATASAPPSLPVLPPSNANQPAVPNPIKEAVPDRFRGDHGRHCVDLGSCPALPNCDLLLCDDSAAGSCAAIRLLFQDI
jgi:hypothetical protein